MSTVIRPEVSKTNPYYISKHRYYELKHFCLQYPEWKAEYNNLLAKIPEGFDPTCDIGIRLSELSKKMAMVKTCALDTDVILGDYIFKAITEDRSYVWLKGVMNIPCGKGVYYELYRKFWKKLSGIRDS